MKKHFWIPVLLIFSLACGITIPTQKKTGELQTKEINIPLSDSEQAYDLTLKFGAGDFILNRGSAEALVSGTATYNVKDFEPKVTVEGRVASVEQGDFSVGGIPSFSEKVKNKWDLQLNSTPMALTIHAGAYKGQMELGGLAIERLSVTDGAADVHLAFSSPNLIAMKALEYTTGASDVTLSGLANARFAKMDFASGAGDYTLDFSGDLLYEATVLVSSGLSSMTIIVPKGVNLAVTVDSNLTDIDNKAGWQKSGKKYIQEGDGPALNITVKMNAGQLTLKTP